MKKSILLVNPSGTQKKVYQDLSVDFSAVVPPFWHILIAGYLRKYDIQVYLLDSYGLNQDSKESYEAIKEYDVDYVAIINYGHQTASATPFMQDVENLFKIFKENGLNAKTIVMGRHISALPEQSLLGTGADYLIQGEGFYSLRDLVCGNKDMNNIGNLWFMENGVVKKSLAKAKNIEDLTNELSDPAWDLIDWTNTFYRAYNWQSLHDLNLRKNFAEFYTSLGCPYNCTYCSVSSFYGENRIRFWSVDWVMNQFDILVNKYNIKIINIMDELFIVNRKHYLSIVEALIERNYENLSIAVFARVNTLAKLSEEDLKKFKAAGINWIKLGIEASSEKILKSVNKDQYTKEDIKLIFNKVHSAGIYILADYMFGLPEDDYDSMQENLNFAIELNAEYAFFFTTMAFPGSKLYEEIQNNFQKLPENWSGYSFMSYDCKPLSNNKLSAKEILAFRDYAWNVYFNNPRYLNMIENKFGKDARTHIESMAKHRLKRKLLGD